MGNGFPKIIPFDIIVCIENQNFSRIFKSLYLFNGAEFEKIVKENTYSFDLKNLRFLQYFLVLFWIFSSLQLFENTIERKNCGYCFVYSCLLINWKHLNLMKNAFPELKSVPKFLFAKENVFVSYHRLQPTCYVIPNDTSDYLSGVLFQRKPATSTSKWLLYAIKSSWFINNY